MKLLQFLEATTLDESIQQVYQTMQIVAEIEKFDQFFNDMREAWVGGIADFGDPQAAITMQQHPQYAVYHEALVRAVTEHLGDPVVAYRLMSTDQIEEWQSGADMPAIAVSTELSIAKAFRNLAANRGRDDLQVVQLSVPAEAVIMLGHSREHELVVDANYISANEIQFLSEGMKKYSYWDLVESIMLTELQEIGDPSGMNRQELIFRLRDNNWKPIGTDSAYSDVYGKAGSPWAIKILRVSESGRSNTKFQCAMQWYRYCLKNWQSNPHIPQIAFVKTLVDPTEKGGNFRNYVVMMELLENFDERNWQTGDPMHDMVMLALLIDFHGSALARNTNGPEELVEPIAAALKAIPERNALNYHDDRTTGFDGRHFAQDAEQGSDEWYRGIATSMANTSDPRWLRQLAREIYVTAIKNGNKLAQTIQMVKGLEGECSVDLHGNNVMTRPSTGELVITDPVRG